MRSGRRRPASLVLTCEHGGNRVPQPYAHLFRGAKTVLDSHRGWDPGALELARLMARRLDRPLLATTWSRLFVEANRTPTNRRIWSQDTSPLPRDERERILERWWRPHRSAVEDAVNGGTARGRSVVHVAVHSFTPELDGEVRNADVGLLYDSRRKRLARASVNDAEAHAPHDEPRHRAPMRIAPATDSTPVDAHLVRQPVTR